MEYKIMAIENVRSMTARSNEMLELAKRYAEQAEKLPSGDDKRNWLEEEAKRLIEGARALTEQAKSEVSKTT
jgi:hypothetical protein